MSPWLAAVVIAGAAAAVAAKLLLRRRAPLGWVAGSPTRAASGLLVVAFLDRPYGDHCCSIVPTEMRRTIELIDRGGPVPCDARGVPTG